MVFILPFMALMLLGVILANGRQWLEDVFYFICFVGLPPLFLVKIKLITVPPDKKEMELRTHELIARIKNSAFLTTLTLSISGLAIFNGNLVLRERRRFVFEDGEDLSVLMTSPSSHPILYWAVTLACLVIGLIGMSFLIHYTGQLSKRKRRTSRWR